MTQKRTNPYAQAYKGFLEATENHELRVLHENGLYRHLRIQAPGTRMWSWDIITWSGHLATAGDIADGYMFSRLEDMIDFFTVPTSCQDYYSDGAPSIDVRYWAEKLNGGRSREVKVYSAEVFLSQVREHLEEHEDLGIDARVDRASRISLIKVIHEMRGLDQDESQALFDEFYTAQKKSDLNRPSLGGHHSLTWQRTNDKTQKALHALWSIDGLSDAQCDELAEKQSYHQIAGESFDEVNPRTRAEEILDEAREYVDSEEEAHEWLATQSDIFGEDTWEWDLRDYDIHFLFTCYCIELGVRLYQKHRARTASAAGAPNASPEIENGVTA